MSFLVGIYDGMTTFETLHCFAIFPNDFFDSFLKYIIYALFSGHIAFGDIISFIDSLANVPTKLCVKTTPV